MDRRLKDSKVTYREHYQSVYRQTGVLPAELAEEEEFPEDLKYLWNWFQELNRARGSNGFGLSPISYSELDAWSRLTGRALEAWEVICIKDIDLAYLSAMVDRRE